MATQYPLRYKNPRYEDGIFTGADGLIELQPGIDSIPIELIQLNISGGTIVGNNIVNIPDPNANTFIKINSDNSVSALPPINFRNAIGAGNSIAVKRANGNTSLVLLNNDTLLATGAAITLNDTITSNSTTEAATANSVKTAYDLANINAANASYLTTGIINTAILPTIPNSILENNSITIFVGNGLSGGSIVSLGNSITISANSASTTEIGVVRLNDSVTSNSKLEAGTANSVKTVHDLATTANINAANASYLTAGTVGVARLPTIPNSILQNNSITVFVGNGLSGGSTVSLGNSITISANSASTIKAGIVQLNDTLTSSSISEAATANAIRQVNINAANASYLTTGIINTARLPTIPNSILENNSITVSTGNGLSGGSNIALGNSITISANSASTIKAGIVQLNDTLTSSSTSLAATANSVRQANINAANASYLTTGTISNSLLSNIPNSALQNNSIIINGSPVQLGGSISVIGTSNPANTSVAGIVKLNDTLTSNSKTEAATANIVKTLNDKISTLSVAGGTVVGNNIINLVSPNANTFIKINHDNSVNALTPTNFRWAIGAGNSVAIRRANGNTSLVLLNNDEWLLGSTGPAVVLNDTLTSNSKTEAATANIVKTLNDKISTLSVAGGTVVGNNIINLVSPNANTFIKINHDNSVSTLNQNNFRNAIGAGNSIAVKRASGITNFVVLNNDDSLISSTVPIIALNDTLTSNSKTEAATANTVRTLNELTLTKLNSSGGIISGDLIVSGDLTVNGNTITLNTSTLAIQDNIIELRTGNNLIPGDGGIQINLTSDSNGYVTNSRSIKWNDTIGKFQLTNDGITYSNIITDTDLANSSIINTTNASNIVTGTLNNSVLSNIPNSALQNNSIIINGSPVQLGGSISGIGTSTLASTTTAGIVQLNDTLTSSSTLLAATANSVRQANVNAANASYLTTGTISNSLLSNIPNSALQNNSIVINGTLFNLGSSGNVTIQLNDTLTSNSKTEAATANTVKTLYDTINIINNNIANASHLSTGIISTSLLGSGTANSNTYLRGDGTWSFVDVGGKLGITDDISSSILYPMLSSSNTGNITFANTSSKNLFFSPSTGTLSAKEISSFSDINLKDNIIDLKDGLEIIKKINPVEFTWKDSNTKSYGVIAQDIENVLPDLIINENGYKNVKYNSLMMVMLSAIKQLSNKLEEYKNVN